MIENEFLESASEEPVLNEVKEPAVPCMCKKKQVLRPPKRTQNDNSFSSFCQIQYLETSKASDIRRGRRRYTGDAISIAEDAMDAEEIE